MFEEFYFLEKHEPKLIDELLSIGWFRMGQAMFTTNYVTFNQKIYNTIWLRTRIKNYTHTKTYHILKSRNRAFKIELKPVLIDDTHETLFAKYREAMWFQPVENIEHLLHGHAIYPEQVFNTYEINVFDNGKLIGCSYFDIGHKSAQGISSFYDPDYKKYSLGKYLIYLQLDVCQYNQFEYFYPGYFVPGYDHLDYKLKIDSTSLEYLDPEDANWYSIENYEHQAIPVTMRKYLLAMEKE